jgi:hypothetical protein
MHKGTVGGRHVADATICNVAQALSSQQERALRLMLAGLPDSQVADEIGVNRTTLWRWRADDCFAAELNRRRHEVWDASLERLRSLVPLALDALAEELQGARRLRAAAAVLGLAGFRARSKSGIDVRPTGAVTPEALEADRRWAAEFEDLFKPMMR